jgi:hypothetical protein
MTFLCPAPEAQVSIYPSSIAFWENDDIDSAGPTAFTIEK